jgi:hypothetical protein
LSKEIVMEVLSSLLLKGSVEIAMMKPKTTETSVFNNSIISLIA